MRLSMEWRERWKGCREVLTDDATAVWGDTSGRIDVVRMGRGEPIVLVPGLAGGWKLVAPLASRLADTHEVILFGLRGDDGFVAPFRPTSLTDYADDLAGAFGSLRLERPTVLGISFGGAVALTLAIEHPGLIGRLALFGAEARFHKGLGATIAQGVLERYPLPSNNGFVNQFFNLLHGGKPESPELADFVVRRCWETDQGVMADRIRALGSFDVEEHLWRIDAPTLVVAGTKDIVVPVSRQRKLAEAIPDARLAVVEGAGHVGFLTHGAAVAREVLRWARQPQPSPC